MHSTAVSHSIESLLASTIDSVNYKLEKTALPRPAELGKKVSSYYEMFINNITLLQDKSNYNNYMFHR